MWALGMVGGLVTIMLVLKNVGKRNPQNWLNTPIPDNISLVFLSIVAIIIVLLIVWMFKD